MAACWAAWTAACSRRASAEGGPTDTVRVKSQQYPSKTPPKSSTTRSPARQDPVAGAVMRQRRMRPGRDDRVEGQTLEPGLPHRRLEHAATCALADAGAARRANAASATAVRRRAPSRSVADLGRILDQARLLDDPLGRPQRDRQRRAPATRRATSRAARP